MTSKMSLDREKMQDVMNKKFNIRNMSVIAHVDHGKSTLTDALVCRAGLIPESQSGEKRWTDNNEMEIERGITIKSTAVSMLFDMKNDKLLGDLPRDGNNFLVNLIDSPGHVDFSSEVTAALRVTDGALVVVDVISGCSVQTETVLRQALSEKIKPVLVINKLDRAILEQKLEPERLYQRLREIIEQINYLIGVYSDNSNEEEEENIRSRSRSQSRSRSRSRSRSPESEPSVMPKYEKKTNYRFKCSTIDPTKGNVAFAAGKDGWAFTLTQFVEILNKKKKQPSPNLITKLWNENYFNPSTNKWQTSSSDDSVESKKLSRGFNQYVLEPIYKVLNLCLENNYDELGVLAEKLDIKLRIKEEEREKYMGKELMKYFMKKWLPAADAMLELIVVHLPSPFEAQRYRVDHLYEGPLDDSAAIGIRECDNNAPLMIYISKMVPDSACKSKFYAIGRVFSGTAEAGLNVRIMGPDYKIGSDNSLFIKRLTDCLCMIGDKPLSFDSVPAGNIIALSGIDSYLLKSGTITTFELAHNIKCMKFTVSPVLRVAVDPVNPSDLAKFIDGLKKLSRSDQLVQCEIDNGQHIIAGAGELHLEICLRDLENVYAKVPIKTSEPLVTYKETVSERSSQTCLAKSANKLNRIYMTCEPLSQEFCQDIDEKKINLNQDVKTRAKYLQTAHNFDANEAKKIWCFGPNEFDANILVDVTKGVASADDVTSTICAGFQWGAREGVLCQEPLRGVRFNLTDLEYHRDSSHRKGVQLIPAVRRAMMASMLTAQPRLLEPVYLVDIQCPDNLIASVYKLFNRKRGEVIENKKIEGTLLNNVKGYLPVNESTGLTLDGKAFPQLSFHHWQLLPGDPYDVKTKTGEVCQIIRKVKGLKAEMPMLADYLDKL